LKKVIDLTS